MKTLLAWAACVAATGAIAGNGLSAIGDAAMKPLMDAWCSAQSCERGRWEFGSDALAISTVMFERADMAPLARPLTPAETAPYAHQFAGDMMKAPLAIRVANRQGEPAYVLVNKRPGAPLPRRTKDFLAYALGPQGQGIVAQSAGFTPLDAGVAAQELRKLDGFLASLDSRIAPYRASSNVAGAVRSVGSDGMKSLMDRWMRDFRRLQPGVTAGWRWEHLGTLNGFWALTAGETDIAPMGRELWPAELAAYRATRGTDAPLEIRVARGGFDTPQRTTAQAIFVREDNPVTRIAMAQLKAVLGANPTITRWGQLGAAGAWSNRPITIYMPPRVAPNATSMQIMALAGSAWNGAAHEGSIAETAAASARDPGAIGFGGFEEGGPGLKALAVARDEGGPYYEGSYPNASSGRYPLTRYMYIRLNRAPGNPIPAQVKEFLRYILSREGQEPILYSAYFPLTAAEVKEELAKLD